MEIDIAALRKDLLRECHGAYFGGGYGAALIESFKIEDASPQELIRIAKRMGVDLEDYAC